MSLSSQRIDSNTARTEIDAVCFRCTAPYRSDASGEFFECEWLDEIIVGAEIEALDSVFQRPPRRDHDDRRGYAVPLQGAKNLKTGQPRESQVEEDQIERHPLSKGASLQPVPSRLAGIAPSTNRS